MKKARYTSVLFILILLSALMHLPQGQAIVPDSQTISIIDTHDDRFITEAGVGIDAWLCHILDPTMDIRSYLVFRDVEVNYWEPLKNATLRLRTTVNLDFEADSSVTVYGMKFSDLQDEGVITPSFVLSVPYTSASVAVNTSQFYGQQWHEINVTSIVEELIRSYDWDGDGNIGETGDSIGFVIVGAGGYDTRWFVDYHYGTPSLASQLVIHWNHEPPPPSGYENADFNETYGNYTIWFMGASGYSLEPMEYLFSLGYITYTASYDTVHPAPGTNTTIGVSEDVSGTLFNTQRKITRTSNGTIYAVWHKKLGALYQIYIAKSGDNGTTWTGETRISTYAGMSTEHQKYPCIIVDGSDNLHVSWVGQATGFTTHDQVWVNTYNISISDWEGPVRISTHAGMDVEIQYAPSMALDSNDTIQTVWMGTNTASKGIWYANYTTSWMTPVWISNSTGIHECGYPSIAVDSNDTLHVIFGAEKTGDYTVRQIWAINRTVGWSDAFRLSTGPSMHVLSQNYASIAMDSEDNIHVTWFGKSAGPTANKIWYVNYTTSWSDPLLISSDADMFAWPQENGVIAVDSDDVIYILWGGRLEGTTKLIMLLSKNEGTGWNIEQLYTLAPVDSYFNPSIRWAMWPELTDEGYIIADANGTVIMDNGDPLIFNTTDDAQDWIDTEDPDPEDPDPAGEWSTGPGGETGAFTRFRMRLWFLLIGFGCLFGPVLFFAWRRPSGYYLLCGSIVMLIGIGMLLSIGQV